MKIKKFSKKHTDTFKQLGVEVVYLFGSHAKGGTHPMSDVDIGVVFAEPGKYKDNTMDAYSKLYDVLIDVLPKEYLQRRFKMRGHDFDLVFLQFAPISLQYNAVNTSTVLYQTNSEKRFMYQEFVIKTYLDFRYYLHIFDEATLARI